MSSLKYINSFMITIMVLIPFSGNRLNENKIVKDTNKSVLIEEKEKNDTNKIKKRVKLRPEKEVNNIYINKI
ncbi:hypothetical protein NRP93_001643 [Clostridium botulinum]|nr:hypothetical protein [Clostridium botulinum]